MTLGVVKSIRCPLQLIVILLELIFEIDIVFCSKKLIFERIYCKYILIMKNTSQEYDAIIAICRDLYRKKMSDYGSAWRILRLPSLTDQIFIKAQRIRSLQENEVRKVDEGEAPEFIGIINYSIMALIQLDKGIAEQPDLDTVEAVRLFDEKVQITKDLMENKNHDYGEAWRDMRINSLTDLILQKILRVKQIEDNKGKTLVSEGIDANYQDMINYAVFALILMDFKK
jgi:Nucleotide modification associated domain 1